MSQRPAPPHPDLVRHPTRSFGWLDARLLAEGWLARAGPDAAAVLVLLAIAADGKGASFYSRDRMAQALSLSHSALDEALQRLLELKLVAHRPWREGQANGVWQLLPIPRPQKPPRCMSTLKQALAGLADDL